MSAHMFAGLAVLVLVSGPTGVQEPPAATEPRAKAGTADPIAWQDWSEAVFDRARKEDRLVLLDVGAVWCHWCHVMDETTYRDPAVVSLIQARFVPVRVDQDARPDLSNRYEDYGWPATVVFDASGQELVKFQGYIPPSRMANLLRGVVEDPTPGPSVAAASTTVSGPGAEFTPELRRELAGLLLERYDGERGGWGFTHKFLDWDAVEYCLDRARRGDGAAERMARETLDRQLKLIDPVWGGVYQYSDSGDWDHPHFEKIMAMQAENLRVYAQAYAHWGDPRYLQAARDVHRFLTTFLRGPDGAFYVSQDADVVRGEHSGSYFALGDAERRARGVPRVDTHLYARETAWAGTGLLALYAATREERHLQDALKAGEWIVARRAREDGGFRHDAVDVAGPYLSDTIAAARLFLGLHAATGDRAWLARTEKALAFVGTSFRLADTPGFVTAVPSGPHDRPSAQRDENVTVARVANLAFHYTGHPAHRELADHALRYLAVPQVARRFNTGGVLLADAERGREPLRVVVVGRRSDTLSRRLLQAALREPDGYKRIELWDPAGGPLPTGDPGLASRPRAAAFVRLAGRWSPPAETPEQLAAHLRAAGMASPPAAGTR